MSIFDGLRHRVYVLLRGDRYADEVARELRFHAELGVAANARERDAELAARRQLGNSTYYREEVRAVTSLHWIDRLRQDASYAFRGLIRTPAFTLTVVATLGLGIGVNAAMYAFLERLFVRAPESVASPAEVRRLYMQSPRVMTRSGNGVFGSWSYRRFAALRDRFGDTIPVALYSPSDASLLEVDRAVDSARTSYVNHAYFGVLGLRPAIGRFFDASEDHVEAPTPVAVISDAIWERSFRRSAGALGRVIDLKGVKYTVIGVAPKGFSGVDINRVDVWLPVNNFPVAPRNGVAWYDGIGNYFRALARIPDGEIARATARGTAALRLFEDQGRRDSLASLRTGPLAEAAGPADNDPAVSMAVRIGVVAAVVLLIACANVANMLLLRASSRRREIAVRRALGGSTGRLYGQVITESVMLGALSGVAALAFSIWASAALRALVLPTNHWATPALDARVALAMVAAAFAIGFVVGLFPAAFAAGVDLSSALKTGARGKRRHGMSVRALLLSTQAALTVVLLVGGGLFVRSLQNVQSIDLGYDPDGLVVVHTYIRDESRTATASQQLGEIAERLRTKPGVVTVALADVSPMAGYSVTGLFLPGRDSAERVRGSFPTHVAAGPNYFASTGVEVVAGRDFTNEDRVGSAPVIILGQKLARELWPGESPLGKCLIVGKATNACSTVIGIVEDVHRMNIVESVGTQFYIPLAQNPDRAASTIVARARGDESRLIRELRMELLAAMPDQSDWSVAAFSKTLENELRPWRLGAILFSVLGALALVVAAIGTYGVVAYATSQRTFEMGVRIALGARTMDILDLVVRDGLRVVVIGIAIGLAASIPLGRLVASQLFGVVPHDASVLLIAVSTMCALTGVACLIPGWRAARVDPVASLRAE